MLAAGPLAVLLGALALAAGFGLPGGYERMMFYYAYLMDCSENKGVAKVFAVNCAKQENAGKGPCNLNQFIHYIAKNKAAAPHPVTTVQWPEIPPLDATAEKMDDPTGKKKAQSPASSSETASKGRDAPPSRGGQGKKKGRVPQAAAEPEEEDKENQAPNLTGPVVINFVNTEVKAGEGYAELLRKTAIYIGNKQLAGGVDPKYKEPAVEAVQGVFKARVHESIAHFKEALAKEEPDIVLHESEQSLHRGSGLTMMQPDFKATVEGNIPGDGPEVKGPRKQMLARLMAVWQKQYDVKHSAKINALREGLDEIHRYTCHSARKRGLDCDESNAYLGSPAFRHLWAESPAGETEAAGPSGLHTQEKQQGQARPQLDDKGARGRARCRKRSRGRGGRRGNGRTRRYCRGGR